MHIKRLKDRTQGGHISARRVAIFRCTNDETAAMLVYRKNYVGIEPFSNVETSFCSKKFSQLLTT